MKNRSIALGGVVGSFGAASTVAAHNVAGDIDIRVKVAMNSWTPPVTQTLMSKSNSAGSQTSWSLSVDTIGRIVFNYTKSSGGGGAYVATPLQIYADGVPRWIRITIDVNDESGNYVANLYTSDDGVSWLNDRTLVSPGAFTSLKNVSAQLAIGATNNGANNNLAGKVFRAEVRAGIDGTVVAAFDANDGALGANVIQSTLTGEVWTFSGANAVVTGMPDFDDSTPLNYYAVEEALVAFLTAAVPVANVFSVTRLLHIPSLFERIQPSPTPEQLAVAPETKHGAIFLFFSGLDSVNVQPRTVDCETSEQEWHVFIFTRYHQRDFSKSIARKINGMLTARVIRALKDFDWLKYYYVSQGLPENSGASSKLRRVTADKLLVAETRAIEDPTLAETLLAYTANRSSNWKGVSS